MRRLKPPQEERLQQLLGSLSLPEKISQLLHESPALEEYGIPEYNWWNECLHGVARAGRATVFPQAIGMAATFDSALIHRIAAAVSDEARAKYHEAVRNGQRGQYRGLTFWTPNINIFRDPRWGRGQETYGEDPFLTACMGVAYVRGLQGDHPDFLKTAACAKHYAVHSGPEKDRHRFDARVSEQDLRETYLPAFQALVEAGVESVMGAYNRVNGEPCCASPTLLESILRGEWGFPGHVVSDCWAIRDLHQQGCHEIVTTREEAAALALGHGCDLNCGCTFDALLLAVDQGLIDEAAIDRALARLLRTRFLLGMFEPDEQTPWSGLDPSVINCPAHRQLAREAAERGIVLLKNEGGLLPLGPDLRRVSLVGPNAADLEVLLGNYYGSPVSAVSILEGLTERCGESVTLEFRPGVPLARDKTIPHDWAVFESRDRDVVIAVMGLHPRLEGEEGDTIEAGIPGDRDGVELPPHQLAFLERILEKTGRLILILTGGSPMALPEDLLERIPAVLYAWYPGEAGGTAVARVLFGDANPSGRLPFTVPKQTADLPPFEDYVMEGRTYRFSDKEPLFPFGFGLSYTSFVYRDLVAPVREIAAGDPLEVEVEVANTGPRPGREIVQLYLQDLQASVRVPRFKLVGFAPVDLEPGQRQKVAFSVTPEQMSVTGLDGRSFLEPGLFSLTAAGSLPTERSATLGAAAPCTLEFEVL